MFKKVELKQGSEEWKAWRFSKITATQASTLMGLNTFGDRDAKEAGYSSALYLSWAEKTELVTEEFFENDAMLHGSRNEEKARQVFIESTGIDMQPACVENLEYPFMAASLDGLNEEHQLGLEIKCAKYYNSFKKHKYAGIPPYYFAQVQHQLFCTGYENWIFWSWFNNSESIYLVHPDKKFQEELLNRCILFQDMVKNKIEPAEEFFRPYGLD